MSIPRLNARNVALCSAGTVAEVRTSTRAASMNPISCFARLAGMTLVPSKAENLFGKLKADSPLRGDHRPFLFTKKLMNFIPSNQVRGQKPKAHEWSIYSTENNPCQIAVPLPATASFRAMTLWRVR
jgi:hypothetical protein